MFLEQLETQNLKGDDVAIRFTERVTLFVGPNGGGKSAIVHDALSLLARGRIPAPDVGFKERARNADVLDLARDPSLPVVVTGTFKLPERLGGGRVTARRTWKLKRGTVKQTVDLSQGWDALGWARPTSDSDKQRFLEGALAAVPEAWTPSSLTAATPETMRAKLLAMVPRDAVDVAGQIPPDWPAWAKPHSGGTVPGDTGDHDVLDWIPSAVSIAKEKLSEAKAAVRLKEEHVESLEAGWKGVRDPAPIHAKLAELRAEKQRASAGAKRRELEEKRGRLGQLVRARAEMDADPLSLGVQAALQEIVAAQVAADRRQLQHELGNQQQVVVCFASELKALGDVDVDAEITATADRLRIAAEDLEATRSAYRDAAARVNALSAASPLATCPDCGADLVGHLAAQREAAEVERDRLKDEGETKRRTHTDVKSRLDDLVGVRDAVKAKARVESLTAGLAALESYDLAALSRSAADARERITDITERERDINALALDIEILEEEAADEAIGASARPDEVLETEIRAAEDELQELGKENAKAEQLAEAKEELQAAEEEAEQFGGIHTRLKEIRAEALSQCVSHLEERIADACGHDVRVRLVNDAGKDDCRITFAGVPINALSTGQRLMTTFAIVQALSQDAKALWRALPLDRFESVSEDNREPLLRAIVDAVRDHALDQVLLAGCPDSVPSVAGVQVLEMRGGEVTAVERGERVGLTVVDGKRAEVTA